MALLVGYELVREPLFELLQPVPGAVTASFDRDTRFHDLRHTFATIMLQNGEHPKVVQEMLGHAQISETMDTYSHVLPNMQDSAVERLDQLL